MLTKEEVRKQGLELGLNLLGFARAEAPSRYQEYLSWLKSGYQGDLWYLEEESRRKKRSDVRHLLPEAKTVLVGALSYAPLRSERDQEKPQNMKIARYARGRDYHKIMKGILRRLDEILRKTSPAGYASKIYVDTGPILERDFAEASGLGWIGKNGLVLEEETGSYLVLGEILTSLEFPPDEPKPNRCGTCTLCLEACPTQAFIAPYILDAQKCISYHTLERRDGEIPETIQMVMNGWVAGCDICQEVCPWNESANSRTHPDFNPRKHAEIQAEDLLKLSETEFRKAFSGTALLRTGLKAFQRNVRSALGALSKPSPMRVSKNFLP